MKIEQRHAATNCSGRFSLACALHANAHAPYIPGRHGLRLIALASLLRGVRGRLPLQLRLTPLNYITCMHFIECCRQSFISSKYYMFQDLLCIMQTRVISQTVGVGVRVWVRAVDQYPVVGRLLLIDSIGQVCERADLAAVKRSW